MTNSDSIPSTAALRAAHLIERLGRLLRAGDHAAGLNPAQAEALRYLARANRFSRTPASLAVYLGSTRGTVSQTLMALEAKGLLTRAKSSADARARCIRLTAVGRRTYRRLWAESEGFRLRLAAVLTDAEQMRLLDMLDRLARVNAAPARPVSTAQGD